MADPAAQSGKARSGIPFVQLDRQQSEAPPQAAIVVGFDRSTASRAALAKAAQLGGQLSAQLHVIHAVDLSDYPVDPDTADWEEQAARNLAEESEWVSATLAGYQFGWSYGSVRADPAEALDRVACEVDATMIVVGVRSHGWRHILERLASPSLSHRLINHCHVPVLVVSYPEAGQSG